MKLLRYREGNSIKPGILDNENKIRDISSLVNDWTGKTINEETINKVNGLNLSNLANYKSRCINSTLHRRCWKVCLHWFKLF